MIFCNNSSIASELAKSYVFLDTNSLIGLLNEKNFFSYMLEIKEQGCQYLTIPSVAIEFLRTDNLVNRDKRTGFLNEICDAVYPIEKQFGINEPLFFVFSKVASNASLVDLYLYLTLHKFKQSNAFLLTENHKDFSTTVLQRHAVITVDSGQKQIRNYGLYRIDESKIEKVVESILRTGL